LGDYIYDAVLHIAALVQMSLYWDHAKLVADPDERTGMTAIHFHEGVQVLNGGDV